MTMYIQQADAHKRKQSPGSVPGSNATISDSASVETAAACCKDIGPIAPHQSYAYASTPFHPSSSSSYPAYNPKTEKLKPLEMTKLQAQFIDNSMKEMKERASKRQKFDGSVISNIHRRNIMLNHTHTWDLNESVASCNDSHDGDSVNSIKSNSHGGFDILEELDAQPDVIQVIATAGGLISHWNEAFTKITKPSTSLQTQPLTIFELIDSKSLSSLYSMLALSLHNISVADVEEFTSNDLEGGISSSGSEGAPSHLSITLPCKQLSHDSSISYNITVVFMNDIISKKRCFLGIFTPRARDDDCSLSSGSLAAQDFNETAPKSNRDDVSQSSGVTTCPLPSGKILLINDDLLCRVLLGTDNCDE